jgi:beta-glucosidase
MTQPNTILPPWQSLSLKAQIGQMIMVRASGHLFDRQIRYPVWEASNQQLQQWLTQLNLGGVILLSGSSAELKLRTQQLQARSTIPLFIAADIEEGVGQRFAGATWFPPPMALGEIARTNLDLAIEYATAMGAITAREALAVGINWLLAPVVDVNNNPDNPVINIRAFGDRQKLVSHLASAFISGAKSYPVLTTAKHFPGHGDTATDSHLDLPTLYHDETRLNKTELPPFQAAIASQVDSVMTAHLSIPSWDKKYPATLSPQILTEKLRGQLGFNGLIITDALIMGGIANYASPEEIAVMAVEAGNDILLMPDNPQVAIESIYQAVQTGRISQEKIEASLARIWQAKTKINENRALNDNDDWLDSLADERGYLVTRSILQDSSQSDGNIPLEATANLDGRNLIIVDDVLNCSFLDIQTPAVTMPQQWGYQRQIIDRNSINFILEDTRPTLLQIFLRGNPFQGTAGLTPATKEIYQQLMQRQQLDAIVIYGSPYVADWFKQYIPDSLPWLFTYGQMPAAQAIALQTLFGITSKSEVKTSANFGF